MKRILCFCLVLGVGVWIGRMFGSFPQTATAGRGLGGGGEQCASENGDVNADGTTDVSDAVTILGYLFLGSPMELVALCDPPAASSGLPDTGQTWCYDESHNEINCSGSNMTTACRGQDGAYATGCPSEGRFVDNLDGTVTDHCTGLQWQKDTADVNGDGQLTNQDSVTWCNALRYCEILDFAGHRDWRLPNVRELQSIVDYGRFNPAIDPVFGALSSGYWSSTSSADGVDLSRGGAWGVDLAGGDNYLDGKGGGYYMRAVRTGQ